MYESVLQVTSNNQSSSLFITWNIISVNNLPSLSNLHDHWRTSSNTRGIRLNRSHCILHHGLYSRTRHLTSRDMEEVRHETAGEQEVGSNDTNDQNHGVPGILDSWPENNDKSGPGEGGCSDHQKPLEEGELERKEEFNY